ncbi:Mss4-like protein [Penicillium herquei]|nr:Mss4-like protein [Penicillium herquei]
MSEETAYPHLYNGGCHCGKVRYTAHLASPVEEQVSHTCNCSICTINGYILVYVQKDQIIFHDEDGAAKEYRFGSRKYPHHFCTNCGTSVYARSDGGEYEDIVAVNGRTLKDVDISKLKIEKLDGKEIQVP